MALTMLKSKPIRDPAEIPLQPLADDPRYQAVFAELQKILRRITEAEKREKVARARAAGQTSTTSQADRAKALIAGGSVVSLPAAAEITAAEEELNILNAARIAQCEKLAAIAGEISYEVGKRFAAINAEALRSALDAATTLFQALEIPRVIRARLIAGGYVITDAALPTHMFPAGAALGDPDRVGMTPANQFKQWLRDKEII